MLTSDRNGITRLASLDSQFAETLLSRETQAQKLSGSRIAMSTTHQEQYLDELASEGQIGELINTATRYRESYDEAVRVAASRHLASALLRSEGNGNRQEGFKLSFQILDEAWANSADYCLAAAAAESIGDNELAEETSINALEKWPNDPKLRDYCRSLATQLGSQTLRQLLDENGENG